VKRLAKLATGGSITWLNTDEEVKDDDDDVFEIVGWCTYCGSEGTAVETDLLILTCP
jgi:hypothetical protein